MLGFIKKDVLMIKSNSKLFVILFVIYGMMAMEGKMDLFFLLPFMSVMIMISTFSYDQYNHWDSYLCTLPGGRKNSVRAKYISTLLMILGTTVIITIASFVISQMRAQTISYQETFMNVFGVLFATFLIQSLMYPSIYKFGVEKARIGIFIIVFGTAIIGGIVSKFVDFSKIADSLSFRDDYILFLLPVLMMIMLYVSYKISERIYIHKEF